MSNIRTTKYFTDSWGPDIYRITNIHFDLMGKDPTDRMMKVKAEDVRAADPEYAEYINYPDDATYELSYLRTMLMFDAIEIKYDYEYISEINQTNDMYEDILCKHQNETYDQPWCATYSDLNSSIPKNWDEFYKFTWPSEWHCVIPASTTIYIDGDEARKKVIEHLIYEYLLNTLPITIID